MSINAYLILSSAQSGRRGLCVDVCKNAFEQSKVKVFLSENEEVCADDEILSKLENVEVIKYSSNDDAFEKLVSLNGASTDVVLYVADSTQNLADEIENFKAVVDTKKVKLTRVWSIIDCKMNAMFPKKVAGFFEALSHFADCVLLSQRSGVANTSINDIVSLFNKQCKPHIIVYMDKYNRVQNAYELVIDEARRISMLFDEFDPIDELDLDEDNLPEEPFSLERKPDPYIEKYQNGQRKNPIPDVSEFVKLSHQ